MKKTKLMLEAEKKLGEPLEIYLRREYIEEFRSSTYIGRKLYVPASTVRRWLPKFDINVRVSNEHLKRRIKYPSRGVLAFCYNYRKISVKKIAEQRWVHPKTVYRWMEREGVKRRHGTEAYLKNGLKKPLDEELEELCNNMKRVEIASKYGVCPDTIDRWKQKAGLYKKEKSKYDNRRVRKKMLEEIIRKTGKELSELRHEDFRSMKQFNGKSYRGLLLWYFVNYGYSFSETKNHLLNEFYNNK